MLGGSVFLASSRLCVSTKAKVLLANNTSTRGGAIYLYSSVIKISEGTIIFQYNTALDVGGGLYAVVGPDSPCFYFPGVGYTGYINGTIEFENNIAKSGVGQHIYGSSTLDARCSYDYFNNEPSTPFCLVARRIFRYYPDPSHTFSVVSSDPQRVCVCDSNGSPSCAQLSKIFVPMIQVYPGEMFQLSLVVVGYDFGTTKGTVHASFLPSLQTQSGTHLLPYQYDQWTGIATQCSSMNYSVYSFNEQEVMYLHSQRIELNALGNVTKVNESITNRQKNDGCIDELLLTTPVFVNVTLLPCPPGFYQHKNEAGEPSGCVCNKVLTEQNFRCPFINKTGYHIWNTSMWVNVALNSTTVLYYNKYCPLGYCKATEKVVNLGEEPDAQCASHRSGTLCGACMENFSLAIGSSKCLRCSNDKNLALVMFFVGAGIFLVFFILSLNMTVARGWINGVVFYANVLWTYKPLWFPSKSGPILSTVQVFVAWLNLDFGIETCFVQGLNAFSKTWLQFLFPMYVWAIAIGIIVVSHYSYRFTKLIGNRAVPLLATLFLVSYIKLLRTIIEALSFAVLTSQPEGDDLAVWYLDGTYPYCKHPHIYLFITALLALVLLWSPYTLLLLSVQWLRRMSQFVLLRWVTKLTPFFDACYAPLKDKHQYWFGVLLMIRGILLLIFSLTFDIVPDVNLLILLVVLTLLLLYTNVFHVYKHRSITIHESVLLGNLIIVCGSKKVVTNHSIIVVLSISLTVLQFLTVIVWNLVKLCVVKRKHTYTNLDDAAIDFIHERT